MIRYYLFLVGIGTGIDVDLVGRIALSELLMAAALPVLLMTNQGRFLNKTFKRLYLVAFLYAVGVVIADGYNENHLIYFMRGIARPVFLSYMTFFFLLSIKRDPRCVVYLFYGMLPGAVFGYFDTTELVGEFYVGTYNYFNAKWTPILTSSAVILCIVLYRFSRIAAALVILIPGAIVSIYGARSGAIAFMFCSLTFVFMSFLHNKNHHIRLSNSLIMRIVGFFVLSCVLIYSFYIHAAPRGYLGDLQQQKFFTQSSTKFGATPWGIIAAGRFDFVVCTLAALDAPIIGHGSWPQTGEYAIQAALLLGDSLTTDEIRAFMLDMGSGHSVIMGTWMNHGILGALYWIYVLYLTVAVFIFLVRRETILTPTLLLPFYLFLWAYFFSPLNLPVRLYGSLFPALAVCFLDKQMPLVSRLQFKQLNIRQRLGD